MEDIVFCRECKHRVPPMCPNGRSYCAKLKVYIYGGIDEVHCIHGEIEGRGKTKKQIEWALYVLNNGAWRDNISDDVSDADMNPLYFAIDTVNDVLKRLTHCSECKYFKQTSSTSGDCEWYNCRKAVFDFCSEGDAWEEEE